MVVAEFGFFWKMKLFAHPHYRPIILQSILIPDTLEKGEKIHFQEKNQKMNPLFTSGEEWGKTSFSEKNNTIINGTHTLIVSSYLLRTSTHTLTNSTVTKSHPKVLQPQVT